MRLFSGWVGRPLPGRYRKAPLAELFAFIQSHLRVAFCISGDALDTLKKARLAYHSHKGGAKRRGIEFKLTFEEWWDIWKPHFHNRGRNKGQFAMCRTMDKGAYEVGNVRIDTVEGNGRTKRYVNFDRRMAVVHENNKPTEDYVSAPYDDEDEFTESWVPQHLRGYSSTPVW